MKTTFALSLVAAAAAQSPLVINNQQNDILCDICPVAVNAAVSWVDALDKNAFNTKVEQVCTILPTSFQDDCDSIIPVVTSEVFNLFDNYVTSDLICGDFLQCPTQTVVADDNAMFCTECQAAVSYGINWLENDGEANVQALLDNLCTDLGDWATPCASLVDTYLPELVSMLDNVDPKDLCTDIGSCDAEEGYVSTSNDFCDTCTAAVDSLETYISSPDNQAVLIGYAHNICGLLGDEADTCNEYVDAYGPLVLLEAKNLFKDSTKVCTDIGLCSSL